MIKNMKEEIIELKKIINYYEIHTDLYYCKKCDIYSSNLSPRQMASRALVEVKSIKSEIWMGYSWFKDCAVCGRRLKIEYSE